jgi:hypothetical protein
VCSYSFWVDFIQGINLILQMAVQFLSNECLFFYQIKVFSKWELCTAQTHHLIGLSTYMIISSSSAWKMGNGTQEAS